MPDDFTLLRFQCGRCASALNLIAVDRTRGKVIDIEFLCYNCLIESDLVTADKAVFHDVTGVKSAP
ncbi:MAG: hypothetical protein WC169_09715 [Dehalococcoidia bacterium]